MILYVLNFYFQDKFGFNKELGTLLNIIEGRYSNSEPYKYAKNFAQKKKHVFNVLV